MSGSIDLHIPFDSSLDRPAASVAPFSSFGKMYGIVVPVERYTWAYYTEDEALYKEYLHNGFCGMNEAFRSQFTHTCDKELAPLEDSSLPTWLLVVGCFLLIPLISLLWFSLDVGQSMQIFRKARGMPDPRYQNAERGEYNAVASNDQEQPPTAREELQDGSTSGSEDSSEWDTCAEPAPATSKLASGSAVL